MIQQRTHQADEINHFIPANVSDSLMTKGTGIHGQTIMYLSLEKNWVTVML